MKHLIILLVLVLPMSSLQAQQDSLSQSKDFVKLSKDICGCWKKNWKKLPNHTKQYMERFSEFYETLALDVRNYYGDDSLRKATDLREITAFRSNTQSCIDALKDKHSSILTRYKFFELQYELAWAFEDEWGQTELAYYFEYDVLTTHTDQLSLSNCMSRLINSVQDKYGKSSVDHLHSGMQDLIVGADGDVTKLQLGLEKYAEEYPQLYNWDTLIYNRDVWPRVEAVCKETKENFPSAYGDFNASNLDYFLNTFVYREKYIEEHRVAIALVRMWLAQQ